jgi:hypothetical protein
MKGKSMLVGMGITVALAVLATGVRVLRVQGIRRLANHFRQS